MTLQGFRYFLPRNPRTFILTRPTPRGVHYKAHIKLGILTQLRNGANVLKFLNRDDGHRMDHMALWRLVTTTVTTNFYNNNDNNNNYYYYDYYVGMSRSSMWAYVVWYESRT